jgi:hypothetical protein
VFLIAIKRTRLIVEYPEGRRYSLPVERFVEVALGEQIARLPEEARERRELVRALAGRSSRAAETSILHRGLDMIGLLLDERWGHHR